jgi:hypothetical protein
MCAASSTCCSTATVHRTASRVRAQRHHRACAPRRTRRRLLASDCQQLGGAVDSEASDKACALPALCRCAAVAGDLARGYAGVHGRAGSEAAGRGASHVGAVSSRGDRCACRCSPCSCARPTASGPWPWSEAVSRCPTLPSPGPPASSVAWDWRVQCASAFARNCEAEKTRAAREALFETLLAQLYDKGKALEAAAHLEIDAVIDPAETRAACRRCARTMRDGARAAPEGL